MRARCAAARGAIGPETLQLRGITWGESRGPEDDAEHPCCAFCAQIKRYLGRPIGSEPPHIYAIADRMYRLLLSSRESQASLLPPRTFCLCLSPPHTPCSAGYLMQQCVHVPHRLLLSPDLRGQARPRRASWCYGTSRSSPSISRMRARRSRPWSWERC